MRNRSAAKSAASSPPSPLRISRMTFFLSLGSVGNKSRRRLSANSSRLLLERGQLVLRRAARKLGIRERVFVFFDAPIDLAPLLKRVDHGLDLGALLVELLQLPLVRRDAGRAEQILDFAESAFDRFELLDREHEARSPSGRAA